MAHVCYERNTDGAAGPSTASGHGAERHLFASLSPLAPQPADPHGLPPPLQVRNDHDSPSWR